MEVRFKIGEIAEMYDVSIRALRLYDKMDLFKPGYTDEQTGYRYYTADQLQHLNTIIVFKSIGIKLVDIKVLIDKGINPELLLNMLNERQEYWEAQIEIAKFNLENIEKIKNTVELISEKHEENNSKRPDAYKMSRLVCLENLKISNLLTEVLWL